MITRIIRRLSRLLDVDDSSRANDRILRYKTGSGNHEYTNSVAGLIGQLGSVQIIDVSDGGVNQGQFDGLDFTTNLNVVDNGDGTASIDASGASTSPAGSNRQIQINDGGSFGAEAGVEAETDGTIKGKGFASGSAEIADDSVHSFTPPTTTGLLIIHNGSNVLGVGIFDISTPTAATAHNHNGFAMFANGLSGTTGTDTQLNVGTDTTNGTLDIENRLGSTQTFEWTILG